MPALTKEQILAAEDLPVEKVAVPSWGGDVYLRTLSGLEREAWEKETVNVHFFTDREGNQKQRTEVRRELFRAKLLAKTIVGEDGAPLFSSHEDLIALAGKSAKVLESLFDRSLEMNGLTKKELQEMEKNSEAPPAGDLNSGSH